MKAVDKVDREQVWEKQDVIHQSIFNHCFQKGEWILGAICPLKNADWISQLLEYAEREGVGK